MGAGAAQGGHIWRACKASSAPLSTMLATRFALPSATAPQSMTVPPAPAAPRPDHLSGPLREEGVMGETASVGAVASASGIFRGSGGGLAGRLAAAESRTFDLSQAKRDHRSGIFLRCAIPVAGIKD